ncbi:MAG TPA: hypothetical protein VGC91_02895, partial [Pyrinomonadaceae bacterium]
MLLAYCVLFFAPPAPLRETFGSGLVTLGIEKEKAKCGQWRLSWLVTESIMLRLPCVALIAEVKHAI